MAHRIGIIGLGTVGSRFVELFTDHDDFEVVAAWDLSERARAGHDGRIPVVDGADEVISAADAVYIAVPPLHHRAYVEACVDAGTAIFCEKPLGIDVAESEELVEAVRAGGRPAGVNFVYSAAPAAVWLGDVIAVGELGDVLGAELRLHFAHWPRGWQADATWLADREQGGWLREVASHHLFLLSRAIGPLGPRRADVTYPDGASGSRCETDAVIDLIAGDRPVRLVGTVGGAAPDVVELVVRGDRRSARISDWYRSEISDGGPWEPVSDEVDRPTLAGAAYRAQLDELAAMLDGRPHRLATFDEALEVQRFVESTLDAGG